MPSVLDASALLAYLGDERGAEAVADAIADGASISTVNLAEVLTRVAARGGDPVDLVREMTTRGLLDGAISTEPFTAEDALEVARLHPRARERGLSLGGRACIALAVRTELPVLTADRAWSMAELPVELRQIR